MPTTFDNDKHDEHLQREKRSGRLLAFGVIVLNIIFCVVVLLTLWYWMVR